ncbi:MAG: polysaccharide biosynthesis protein, partial [Saprospiraceae bacterium]|nr:polysaccharide biosynthesis protein [Saprospiraceae bacterium]
MKLDFNLTQFISQHITLRSESLCQEDVDSNIFHLYESVRGKSVLVIGGAGTIGSNFIKSLLPFQPARLVVVDSSENGLTELTRDLRSSSLIVPKQFATYPVDFGDKYFHNYLHSQGPFQIIANFAAHKHVRSEKDILSIEAMIRNNVIKTFELLQFLSEHQKPEHFFCVSTDKATEPVNVMGATKLLMEKIIFSFKDQMKVTSARFANVAFSNGSLLDGYLYRINKKQPLSCPNNVKRYFVSPEESGHICLLACLLGRTGEIFFPKLEESKMKNFRDITSDFLNSLGFREKICVSEQEAKSINIDLRTEEYPVYYFDSHTSGEKLYESFYTPDDQIDLTRLGSLGIISHSEEENPPDRISRELQGLVQFFGQKNISKN